SNALPFISADDVGFAIEGKPAPALGMEPSASTHAVTPGYFSALRIPVLQGRPFAPTDNPTSLRVAIVNQNFARHFFAGENPIGHSIKILSVLDGSAFQPATLQIVGVVGNTKEVGLNEVDFDTLYLPIQQNPIREVFLAVRTRDDAPGLPAILRHEAAL